MTFLFKICHKCKIKQPLVSFHKDISKRDGLRTACKGCDNRNKGMREYQLIVTYFLVLDRIRGASYNELAEKYKLDKSNMSKRIRGVLNAPKTQDTEARAN